LRVRHVRGGQPCWWARRAIAFDARNGHTLAAFNAAAFAASIIDRRMQAMSAYIVADCEVTDPIRYERYKKLAQAAVAKHGGRYVVRGGEVAVLEGEWQPHRLIVLEFPSPSAVRRFYASAEYRAARAEREGAARMSMITVAGI